MISKNRQETLMHPHILQRRLLLRLFAESQKDLKLTKTTECEGKLTVEKRSPEAKWGKS